MSEICGYCFNEKATHIDGAGIPIGSNCRMARSRVSSKPTIAGVG